MDEGLTRDRELIPESGQAGFTTPQWVLMVGIAMVLMAMLLNLVTFQYAQGAVQTAVDEAARAGSALDGSIGVCQSRANEILHGRTGLLRGRLGQGLTVSCVVAGNQMVATASGSFQWWVGGLPDIVVQIEGRSVLELAP